MKKFGRTIRKDNSWKLWFGAKEYPIIGSFSELIHGGLVTFSLNNLQEQISSEYLTLYAVPDQNFLIPEKDWPLKTLFTNRLNYFQSPEGKLLITAKSQVLQAIRNYLISQEFVEVITPTLVSSLSSGKVSRFEVDFDNKKVFLTMSFLTYLNLLCYADNDKVFQSGNVYQAGQSNTPSQVNEYFVIDFAHNTFSQDILEEIELINQILLNAIQAFNKLRFIPGHLLIPQNDFMNIPVISYEVVVAEATKRGESIDGQKHLSPRALESIRLKYNDLFWVYDFPCDFKPFYCSTRMTSERKSVVSAELWWRGFKIATTSLTQNKAEEQEERIKYLGLNVDDYSFYLKAMKNGVAPTFVSTINFERLLAKMLNLKTVKEIVLFPRATRNTTIIP